MTTATLPKINELIEVAVPGGESYQSRVEDDAGRQVTVAAPLNLLVSDMPEIGSKVAIRWTVHGRGRYAVPGKIVELRHGTVSLWVVEITGPTNLEQNRNFVRGGGGEPIQLERTGPTPGEEPVKGRVVDVSERSVRGRFAETDLKAGDTAAVRIVLDDVVVTVSGSVLRVVEQPDRTGTDVIAVFQADEAQAKVIRRYVLRQQMLARARTAD
jgi:hypothetical protein